VETSVSGDKKWLRGDDGVGFRVKRDWLAESIAIAAPDRDKLMTVHASFRHAMPRPRWCLRLTTVLCH
jgi:hypothetical protein